MFQRTRIHPPGRSLRRVLAESLPPRRLLNGDLPDAADEPVDSPVDPAVYELYATDFSEEVAPPDAEFLPAVEPGWTYLADGGEAEILPFVRCGTADPETATEPDMVLEEEFWIDPAVCYFVADDNLDGNLPEESSPEAPLPEQSPSDEPLEVTITSEQQDDPLNVEHEDSPELYYTLGQPIKGATGGEPVNQTADPQAQAVARPAPVAVAAFSTRRIADDLDADNAGVLE